MLARVVEQPYQRLSLGVTDGKKATTSKAELECNLSGVLKVLLQHLSFLGSQCEKHISHIVIR